MKKETRYTLVNRNGEEIFHSNSFLGFIAYYIATVLLIILIIAIIGAIICGIASIFD